MTMPGAFRVANWHITASRRMWGTNLLSALAQPLLYLLGLGVGVGTLVDRNSGSADVLGGIPYVAYVAPGLMVSTAMTLGAFESMWPVLGGLKWQRGYHGIAATPLEARDIVLGHAVWIAVRSAVAAGLVAVVLTFFADTRSWGLIPAVLMSVIVGVAFAMPVMATSVDAEWNGQFAAIQRFVIIPLFLFGGAFYPLSQLPEVVQWLARAFPLWHGVVVARAFTTGGVRPLAVLGHVAYCAAFIVVGAVISTRRLRRKLYP